MTESDHRFFTYYTLAGKKTSVCTKKSHISAYKSLGDNLVSAIAKQCGVTKPQFIQLVACPLSREKLEEHLIDSSRIK